MALIDITRGDRRTASFADPIRARFANALGAFADWNDMRRTRKALMQLSAHELDDIGLTPADIDALSLRNRY